MDNKNVKKEFSNKLTYLMDSVTFNSIVKYSKFLSIIFQNIKVNNDQENDTK